jgi:hypothetical protein
MSKRTWLSLSIIFVMLLTLCWSAAFATDGVTGGTGVACPAGYLSTFNANKVGCTFCAADSPTCEFKCLGSPVPPPCPEPVNLATCCPTCPCCYPCPSSTSLECNVSSCECDPSSCCFTTCPAPAPALGAPNSTLFGVVAGALAIAGVLLIRRRRRPQRQ